ncbi:MAG TPA: hypothetical protein VE733_29020 [Streptosporangiaceae bacterium]|jgi:hypothetical protein|nr:hypothetical protein [Streptosporangiaceae bacterium]
MHRMLKRAAVSAIPALVGLAVFPATAMAAPHTSRAVAGPAKGGREAHERHLAGNTGTAKTTAHTPWFNGTDDEFAATPATPVIAVGGPGIGILVMGRDDKSIGNQIADSGGSGNTMYRDITGSETGSVGSTGSTNTGNGAGANSTGTGAGSATTTSNTGNGAGANKSLNKTVTVPAP